MYFNRSSTVSPDGPEASGHVATVINDQLLRIAPLFLRSVQDAILSTPPHGFQSYPNASLQRNTFLQRRLSWAPGSLDSLSTDTHACSLFTFQIAFHFVLFTSRVWFPFLPRVPGAWQGLRNHTEYRIIPHRVRGGSGLAFGRATVLPSRKRPGSKAPRLRAPSFTWKTQNRRQTKGGQAQTKGVLPMPSLCHRPA